MRILHVISDLNPSSGGPPRVCVRLAAAQASASQDVTIVSHPLGGERGAFDEMIAGLPHFSQVNCVEVSVGRFETLRLTSASARQVSDLVHAADIVHIHNVWNPINRAAYHACYQLHKPFVVQPNGMLDPWALKQRRWKKHLAMSLMFRRHLNRASDLILGHANERDLMRPLRLKPPTTVARLNGLFPEEVNPLPALHAFRQSHPELANDPYVVFMGRFHYKKGLDLLAESFALHNACHPRTRLVMIGIDCGAEVDFRRRISRHDLDSRVHFVGSLHGQAKWEALRGATCFALPSRQEGFSVAVIEALACGVPVVLTEQCHFGEVAERDAGIVTGLDATEIAAAFDVLLTDEAVRERMSGHALDLVSNEFNYHQIASEVQDAYRRCLTTSRSVVSAACDTFRPIGD